MRIQLKIEIDEMEQWVAQATCTNFKSVYDRYEQHVSRELEGVYVTQAMNDLVNYWRQGALQPKEHETYFVNTALPKIAKRMVCTRYINVSLTTSVYLFIRRAIDIAIELLPMNIPAFGEFLVHAFDHSSSFYSSKNMDPNLTVQFPNATISANGLPTLHSLEKTVDGNDEASTEEPTDSSTTVAADGAQIASPASSNTEGVTDIKNNIELPNLQPALDDEEPDVNPYASMQTTTLHFPSQFFPDLVNYFGSLGGFHRLFDHLSLDTTPVTFLSSLLHALRNVCMNGFVLKRRLAQFADKIMELGPLSNGLSIVQLKGTKKEDLESFLRHLGMFMKNYKVPDEASFKLDQLGLRIAEQCLSSGVITLRLFALTFIGAAVDSVLPRATDARAPSPSKESVAAAAATAAANPTVPPPNRWLTIPNLVAWIRQSAILQHLFGDSTHPQLLKNCGKVMRFLAQHEGLDVNDVQLMWKCGSSSYESVANDALNVFFDIVGFLSADLVEPIIQLLYNTVQQTLNHDAMQAAGLSASAEIPVSSSPSSPALVPHVVINNISALAHRVADSQQRMRLVYLLLDVMDGSPVQVLPDCSNLLIETFKAEWFRPHRLEVAAVLLKVLQDITHPNKSFYCGLIDPIVTSYASEPEESQNALAWMQETLGKPFEEFLLDELVQFKETCKPLVTEETYGYMDGLVLGGCTTYIKEIQNRLYLIYHLFSNGQARLSRESALRLWDILYTQALNFGEAEEAAEWFRAAAGSDSNAIPPALAYEIFQERFVNLDFSQLTCSLYNCFERFWIHSNVVLERILLVTNPGRNNESSGLPDFEVAVHPDQLVGEGCIWDIVLTNPESMIRQSGMTLLITCMERLSPALQLEISPFDLRENFISKCLSRIPLWVEHYKAVTDPSALASSSDSIWEHQVALEKSISNALSLLGHLMDSLEPAASKRSTVTRGPTQTIHFDVQLHIPLAADPSNVLKAKFSLPFASSTSFTSLKTAVLDVLSPILKCHSLNPDDVIFMTHYPSWMRLDIDPSVADSTLQALEIGHLYTIRVIHLPSKVGRETMLRSRKGNAFSKNTGEEKARPADAESRIQQICEFTDWPTELVEFALKSHGWDIQVVGNVIMDDSRRHKLVAEAEKAGIGKKAEDVASAPPSSSELLEIMKKRAEAVLSLTQEDGQATDLSLPSNILSSSKSHFDALFELLTLDNDAVSAAVWQIILRIPTSTAIKTALLAFDSPTPPDWAELLPLEVYRLNYTVQIIDQILCPLEDSWHLPKRLQWARWFQETGGLTQLFKVVSNFETAANGKGSLQVSVDEINMDVSTATTAGAATLPLLIQTRRDCLSTTLKIINVFMSAYAQAVGVDSDGDLSDQPVDLTREDDESADSENPLSALERALDAQAMIDAQMKAVKKLRSRTELIPVFAKHIQETRVNILPLDIEFMLIHIKDILAWSKDTNPPVANEVLTGFAWSCYANIALGAQFTARAAAKKDYLLSTDHGAMLSPSIISTAVDLLTDLNNAISQATVANIHRIALNDPVAANSLLKVLLNSLPPMEEVKTADLILAACYDCFYWLLEHLINLRLAELERAQPGSLFGDAVRAQFGSLVPQLIESIRARPEAEISLHGYIDWILNGSARILATLVRVWPTELVLTDFIYELFYKCMFTRDPAKKANGEIFSAPKCRNYSTRVSTFELLLSLARISRENRAQILTHISENHSGPYVKVAAWDFYPGDKEKSSTGYSGLVNLTATCYMNSLIQQFYMMPALRRDLLRSPVVLGPNEPLKENMVYQFHQLLGALQETVKGAHNPKEFMASYRDIEGNPADPNMQQDVSEFFNIVCGTLENSLKGTTDERILQKNFGCVQVSQIKSLEADFPFASEREEDIYAIPLDVRLKNNFSDAMDLFVKQDMLEGDNKYKCDQYDRHIVATKGNLIKTMSNTIIFHLMRFDFDLATYRKRKLNEYFNFPMRINMKRWTKSGQAQLALESAGLPANEELDNEFPEHYYDYQLTGILVHSGSADSGHYYSFIKERQTSGKWVQFNDRVVSEFDPNNIGNECFGGYHQVKEWDSRAMKDVWRDAPTERSAYMLFYERITPIAAEEPKKTATESTPVVEATKATEVLSGNRNVLRPSSYINDVPSEIHTKVWEENANFLRVGQVFDAAYFEFMHDFAALWEPSEPLLHLPPEAADDVGTDLITFKPAPSKAATPSVESDAAVLEAIETAEASSFNLSLQLGAVKTLVRMIFEVAAHAAENIALTSLLNQLIRLLENHVPSAIWFIEYIRRNNLIKEVMLACNIERTRITFQSFFRQFFMVLVSAGAKYVPSVITKPSASKSSSSTTKDSARTNPSATNTGSPSTAHHETGAASTASAYESNGVAKASPPAAPAPQLAEQVLITAFLDLLEDSRSAWRRFKQFFGVIRDYCRLGLPQRTFMLNRGMIAQYVDYFMGQSNSGVSRVRVMDEDNFPDLVEFIETITLLVCSCKNENPSRWVDPTKPPVAPEDDQPSLLNGPPPCRLQIGDLDMPATSKNDLYHATDFFTSLLEMDYNSPSTGDMCEYASWYVLDRTNYVLDHLLTKIDVKPTENKAPVLEYLLYRLLSIDDNLRDHRVKRVMGKTSASSTLSSPYSTGMLSSYQGNKAVKSLLLLAQSATHHAALYVVGYVRLLETIPACLSYVLDNPLDLLWLRKFWRDQFSRLHPQVSCDSHLEADAAAGLHNWFSAAADILHPRHPAHPPPASARSFTGDEGAEFMRLAPEPWKKTVAYLALVFCTHLSTLDGNKEPAYEDLVLEQEKELTTLKSRIADLEKEKKTLAKALMYVHEHYPAAKLQPKLNLKVEDIIREFMFSTSTPYTSSSSNSSKVISGSNRPVTSISYLSAASGNASGSPSSDGPDGARGMSAGRTSPTPGESSDANTGAPSSPGGASSNTAAAANSPDPMQRPVSPAKSGASPENSRRMGDHHADLEGEEEGESDEPQFDLDSANGDIDPYEIQSYPPRGLTELTPNRLTGLEDDDDDDEDVPLSPGGSRKKDTIPGLIGPGTPHSLIGWTDQSDGMRVYGPLGPDPFENAMSLDFTSLWDPSRRGGRSAPSAPSDWEDRVNDLKAIGLCDDDDILKALLEDNHWSVETAANDLFDPDCMARATAKAALRKASETDAGSDSEM